MDNPWIMKMEQFTRFSREDRELLDQLSSRNLRSYGAHEKAARRRLFHCNRRCGTTQRWSLSSAERSRANGLSLRKFDG